MHEKQCLLYINCHPHTEETLILALKLQKLYITNILQKKHKCNSVEEEKAQLNLPAKDCKRNWVSPELPRRRFRSSGLKDLYGKHGWTEEGGGSSGK